MVHLRGCKAALCISLLVAITLGLAEGAQGECLTRLDISRDSKLTFSGTSAVSLFPGAFPLQVQDVGDQGPPQIGLQGSMYLRTPGSCPKTAAEWLEAAGSMQLTAAPSGFVSKPISMFPALLPTEVMGVPLNISGLELNLTLTSRGPAPASQDRPFRMGINANITHGYVYSNSPLTGGASLQPLAANNSISTSRALLNLTRPAGAAAAAAGKKAGASSAQQLNLVLPEFKLTFNSQSSGVGAGGRPWTGSLTFSLTGAGSCVLCVLTPGVWVLCPARQGGRKGSVIRQRTLIQPASSSSSCGIGQAGVPVSRHMTRLGAC